MNHFQLRQFNLLAFIHSQLDTHPQISGQIYLSDLPRIAAEKALNSPIETPIIWHLANHCENQSTYNQSPVIELGLNAEIWLLCQRCLQPYLQPLSTHHFFEIAKTEAEVDLASIDDDEKDVIVGSETFDLLNLFEDELLLALPLIPRHSECHHPILEQLKNDFLASEIKPISPFAKLNSLKEKKRPN